MRHLLIILISLLLFTGCSYNKPVTSQGSFTIDGVTHSFSSIRVDHVGYVAGSDSSRFILRLTAYPGTFSMDTARHKGYGTVLQLFFIASDCDFRAGDSSNTLFSDSLSHVVTIAEGGDTTSFIPVTAASVAVTAAENAFLHYDFSLTSASGVTSGQYTGSHIVNRLVDQPAYGVITFDTICTTLSTGMLYCWNHLFSPDYFYYELIFYSANARFTDAGRLRQGVQFSVGFASSSDIRPLNGDYPVAAKPTAGSLMYGHKVDDATWGTYWTVFYSGSSVGKANILSGNLSDLSITDNAVSFSFTFKDQLDNDVLGYYDGKYLRY